MERALRAAVRKVREPSHVERAELAGATPETQAFVSVRMAEQMKGAPLSSREVRIMARQTRAFADALEKLADDRRRLEHQKATGDSGLGFTLEELATQADAGGAPDEDEACPATEPGGEPDR